MTGCVSTAADPVQAGRLMTCEESNPVHEGTPHHALDSAMNLRTWGAPSGRREPSPDPDFFAAYISGDPLEIAKARAKYSDKLRDAGFPPLDEPMDWSKNR